MTVLDPKQMDIAAATVAVHAFAAANIEPMMPRGEWLMPQPPPQPAAGLAAASTGPAVQEAGGGGSGLMWGLLGAVLGLLAGALVARRKPAADVVVSP